MARRRFSFATLPPNNEPDLLHHYKLDETSGLVALDSASGANATLFNFEWADDAQWVPGKTGGALDLGADDTTNNYARMEIPEFDSFDTGGFTVAMWINPGSQILTPAEYQLLSTPGDAVGFTIMNTNRGGRVHDRVLLFWDGSLPDLHVGTTTLEPGNWYHVAITSTGPGGEKRYYINGFEEEQQLFDPGGGGTEGLHLATRGGWVAGVAEIGGINGSNRTHDTIIDDVRIYGVALDAEAIAGLATTPTVGGLRVPGDCNQDAAVNITDAVCVLGHLFHGNPPLLPCGDGTLATPGNVVLMDVNGDGGVNVSDPVALLNFLFSGGPPHSLAVPGNEQAGCVPIEGCTDDSECR